MSRDAEARVLRLFALLLLLHKALLYCNSYIKELLWVNCLRGSKSKLTGSVVRLKNCRAPWVSLTGS